MRRPLAMGSSPRFKRRITPPAMGLSRALALYLAFAAVTSMALAYGETSPWNLSAFSAIYGAKSAAASADLVPLSVDDYGRVFFWIPVLRVVVGWR